MITKANLINKIAKNCDKLLIKTKNSEKLFVENSEYDYTHVYIDFTAI